jgi:creatinine amidohydrolase
MTGYRRWADLSWPEFGALDPQRTVAVLPVAAIEQHGPHLPLSTDARINHGVLQAALDRVPAAMCLLILPELPVGKSDEHAAYPGTLTLGTETLMRVWFEIAQSVHRAGVRKLLILNSHGGQGGVARIVVQDVRVRLHMLAVAANTYALHDPHPALPASELRHGIHGGAIETSMMLHLQPALVRREHLADFAAASLEQESRDAVLRTHGPTTIGWATQDLNPTGACGDARLATTEMGESMLDQAAHRLVGLLQDMTAYPLTALKEGPLGPDRS